MSEEFRWRPILVPAYGPATLFGLAEGAILPVIALSAIDRGATASLAALVAALIGAASLATNIPAGILATRVGERRSMLVASAITLVGLTCCLVDLGDSPLSLAFFAFGVLLIGVAASVYALARQSYLTEIVPLHLRARALSTLGGTMRIGMFLGPFIGAGAMQFLGLAGAYWVAVVVVLGSGVIVWAAPDLELSDSHRKAAAAVTTMSVLKSYWRVFVTLGLGILLLSAIRASRQIVLPLWGSHLGVSPTTTSIVFGIAGALDAATFYPAGKVMDRFGRRFVAVPSVLVLGTSFALLPLTHGVGTLAVVAMIMGFGNGIGSGIVMTLGADTSPAIGRPTFLGLWRELGDAGAALGPVILSAVTAVAGLASGIEVSALVGFAAAGALWVWIPKRAGHLRADPVPVADASPPAGPD